MDMSKFNIDFSSLPKGDVEDETTEEVTKEVKEETQKYNRDMILTGKGLPLWGSLIPKIKYKNGIELHYYGGQLIEAYVDGKSVEDFPSTDHEIPDDLYFRIGDDTVELIIKRLIENDEID